MTAATTSSTPGAATQGPGAGGAFGSILAAAAQAASAKVDDWSSRLEAVVSGDGGVSGPLVDDLADDLAEGGGAQQQAGVRGVQAGLEGKNPVWAAIKGAWTGGGALVKAAVVTAGVTLVLALLLSPVLLLVFLLSALVIAAVLKARSARK